jgi:dTDP-4-dehydrorhamnose reductase
MRVLITGASGQLGRALRRAFQDEETFPLQRPAYDVTDLATVQALVEMRPHLVIHAAALTDVDRCQREPDLAYQQNALGTRNVALACQETGARMVYISTNEVFDGSKAEPYLEFDQPNPINAYGGSKLAGERYVQMLLNRFYIVRTSWLFGEGSKNFVRKILSGARQDSKLAVVTDEVASPTYAPDLAQAIRRLVDHPVYGVYHFTNAGQCARYDFARAILETAQVKGVSLEPIVLPEYQRDSQPPPYSVLRNFCGAALGITLRPWQEALAEYLGSVSPAAGGED